MGEYLPCFKAYDVRGKYPTELNRDIAYRIGRAYAEEIQPKKVCVGYDIRLSGPEICDGLTEGLNDGGVDVVHLGMVGTEMVYFATAHYGYDGGIMITASHNPPEYNGMKMVRADSRPISGDTGLFDIEKRTFEANFGAKKQGNVTEQDIYEDFINHLLTFADIKAMKPLKILADVGNGAAGIAMRQLQKKLPLQIEEMLYEPDGTFPNGVPNPILEESRARVEKRMREAKFDLGVAWDGDYDRCFFFDGEGNFLEGYYLVGVLAKSLLETHPGAKIIYDPRLTWNTIDIVTEMGGTPVICKSGHAFIKEKMRAEDAIYGGEMSAHHYFKRHWYCDSGLIPLMLIAGLLSSQSQTIGQLTQGMIKKYPCSGEINSTVADNQVVIERILAKYGSGKVDKIDGISIEFDEWRFNLRGSNTEPVLRLNVETRGNHQLMRDKTEELLAEIRSV
jgi:phosphomannomutase